MFVLTQKLLGNLLIRHPGLIKMLLGREDSSKEEEEKQDPYDPSEPDPAKCRAADSSLWEVLTLERHVLAQVSQAAKSLTARMRKPAELRTEWDLAEFLELDMQHMMREEGSKKIFVNVPLTFERPVGMAFAKGDLTSKLFSTK